MCLRRQAWEKSKDGATTTGTIVWMSTHVTLLIQRVPGSEDLPLPEYKSRHAAAMDLAAAVPAAVTLAPGARALIPCGFSLRCRMGSRDKCGRDRASQRVTV